MSFLELISYRWSFMLSLIEHMQAKIKDQGTKVKA